MRRSTGPVIAVLLITTLLAGCIQFGPPGAPPTAAPNGTERLPDSMRPEFPLFPPMAEMEDFLPTGWHEGPDTGTLLPAGLWRSAAAAHAFTARFDATSLLLTGGFQMEAPSVIRIAPAPATFPGIEEATALVLDEVTYQGETGTILLEGPGETLIRGVATEPLALSGIIADSTGIRAPLSSHFAHLGLAHGGSLPAPYNETHYRALALTLPPIFTVEHPGLRFIAANGEEVTGSTRAENVTARSILAAGGFGPGYGFELRLAAPHTIEPTGDLHVQAHQASGSVLLGNDTFTLSTNPLAFSLREPTSFTLTRSDARYAIEAKGDAYDLHVGGHPRLGAAVAAVPNLFELHGEPGQVVAFQVLLVEGSGGGRAHLAGHRVEGGDGLEIRFKRSDPFQVTPVLWDWLEATADFTAEHPIAMPVTVPVMVGLVAALPFTMLLDAFTSLFSLLAPPRLEGFIAPGEGQVATFEVKVPESGEEATLIIQGRNFPEQQIQLAVRPAR